MRCTWPWSRLSGAWRLLGALYVGVVVAGPTDSTPPPSSSPASSSPAAPDDVSPFAPSDVDDSLFASPTTHDHIGRVVVPVMINGQGPFRFVVDTGASHSTISPRAASALGLTPSTVSSIVLDGITGSASVSAVTIDKLQAGELLLDRTSMPVVWAPVLAGADGILGAAGLTSQSLLVDFQHNKVSITGRMGASLRSEALRVHATRLADGLMTIDTLVGRVRVRAVIDTGAQRSLGNLALQRALFKPHTDGELAKVTSVYGATKDIEAGEVLRVPVISAQSLRFQDVELVFGGFHIFKVWNLDKQPAMIIGMDVLGTTTSLGIDFKNQDVYLASVGTAGAGGIMTHGAGAAATVSH
jgi:predicted aspartyl protease